MLGRSSYRILLYYCFVAIDEPELFAAGHLAFCQWLGLKGRIIVAREGLNGTVSGTVAQTNEYMAALRSDPRFRAMEFKIDEYDRHAFRRLSVKARDEIVTFGAELLIDGAGDAPLKRPGEAIEPKRFREMLDDPEVVIIDGRNDYEFDVGHFRGAIRPDFETFKEAPQWVQNNVLDKSRPILTYCTGGIRCEKLSAYLITQGFERVYQLKGGIVSYGKDPEVQGELFEGACFVFDDRIVVPVNRTDSAKVIGKCLHCGGPTESYVNCANVVCNRLYLCCSECEESSARTCSEACRSAPLKRGKGSRLKAGTTGS